MFRQLENGEFFCKCHEGFAGPHCERRALEGEKTTSECQNGGVFVASHGECRCQVPFYGAYCQFSCNNGQMKIWKSQMNVKGVIDKVWDWMLGPNRREEVRFSFFLL